MEVNLVRNGRELGSRMTTLHKSDQSLLCQTTLSFVIPTGAQRRNLQCTLPVITLHRNIGVTTLSFVILTGAQRRDLQCTLPVITLHRNIGVTTLSFVIPSEAEGSAVRVSR